MARAEEGAAGVTGLIVRQQGQADTSPMTDARRGRQAIRTLIGAAARLLRSSRLCSRRRGGPWPQAGTAPDWRALQRSLRLAFLFH